MSLDGKFIKDGTIPSSKWIISPDFVLENKGGTGSFITTNATHTITGGDYSSILGGTNNTITSAGNYILLIGGNNNLIESNAQQSASSSFIIGGGGSTAFAQNHIIGHTSSGIIGGSSNKIGTTTSTGASHNFIINSISTNIDSGNNLVNVIGSVDTTALNAIDGVTALSVQSVTMTQSNTVYMPKVRIGLGINGALEDGSVSDDILVRNILTGEIEIRDASTLGGSASTSGGVISVFGRTGLIQAQLGDYAATLVEYDNGISGLLANNVQEAIDELSGVTISTLDINLDTPVSVQNYDESANLQDVIEKIAEALRNLGLLDTLKMLYGDSTSGAGIKIQSKEIVLTDADILDLHNNSYVIHDAYQDSFIVPIQAVFITVGVNNYAGEEDLELYYDGDSSGSYTFKDALTNTRSGVKRMNIMKQGNNTGVYTDTALLFRAKNNNAVTGTGNGGTLKILYVIID